MDLIATAKWLRKFVPDVVVFGPIVHYDTPLPHLLARSLIENNPSLPDRHRDVDTEVIDRSIKAGLAGSGVHYISLFNTLCQEGKCLVWAGSGVPLQFDEAHLTAEGSKLVALKVHLSMP